MYCTPGPDNSNLINTENAVPTRPANKANIKYNTPISLALEDKNHLSNHKLIRDVRILNLTYSYLYCKATRILVGNHLYNDIFSKKSIYI
jgi:hypothetical protein